MHRTNGMAQAKVSCFGGRHSTAVVATGGEVHQALSALATVKGHCVVPGWRVDASGRAPSSGHQGVGAR